MKYHGIFPSSFAEDILGNLLSDVIVTSVLYSFATVHNQHVFVCSKIFVLKHAYYLDKMDEKATMFINRTLEELKERYPEFLPQDLPRMFNSIFFLICAIQGGDLDM